MIIVIGLLALIAAVVVAVSASGLLGSGTRKRLRVSVPTEAATDSSPPGHREAIQEVMQGKARARLVLAP